MLVHDEWDHKIGGRAVTKESRARNDTLREEAEACVLENTVGFRLLGYGPLSVPGVLYDVTVSITRSDFNYSRCV